MNTPTDEGLRKTCLERIDSWEKYRNVGDDEIACFQALLDRLSAGNGWRPLQEAHVACPNCGQRIHFKFDMNEIRPGDAREQCAAPHTLVVLPEMDGMNAQDSAVRLPSPPGEG